MTRKYEKALPAVMEPDKVYGQAAAAKYAGVSKPTISRWTNGFGKTAEDREATALLLLDIDYGNIDLGVRRYGNQGRLTRVIREKQFWYSKARLRELGRRARENILLRRNGYHEMTVYDYDEPELRADMLQLCLLREGIVSLDHPLPPKSTTGPQSGWYFSASPTVMEFVSTQDREEARALAARLKAEELAREQAEAAKEQAELARELASMSAAGRAALEKILAPAPKRQPASQPKSTTRKPPGRPPTAKLARQAAEAAAKARQDEKMAAWLARTGHPGLPTQSNDYEAS